MCVMIFSDTHLLTCCLIRIWGKTWLFQIKRYLKCWNHFYFIWSLVGSCYKPTPHIPWLFHLNQAKSILFIQHQLRTRDILWQLQCRTGLDQILLSVSIVFNKERANFLPWARNHDPWIYCIHVKMFKKQKSSTTAHQICLCWNVYLI